MLDSQTAKVIQVNYGTLCRVGEIAQKRPITRDGIDTKDCYLAANAVNADDDRPFDRLLSVLRVPSVGLQGEIGDPAEA
ncbi:hypothetical protein [Paraburkholderia terrae]